MKLLISILMTLVSCVTILTVTISYVGYEAWLQYRGAEATATSGYGWTRYIVIPCYVLIMAFCAWLNLIGWSKVLGDDDPNS